jgi:hypothetical protein
MFARCPRSRQSSGPTHVKTTTRVKAAGVTASRRYVLRSLAGDLEGGDVVLARGVRIATVLWLSSGIVLLRIGETAGAEAGRRRVPVYGGLARLPDGAGAVGCRRAHRGRATARRTRSSRLAG